MIKLLISTVFLTVLSIAAFADIKIEPRIWFDYSTTIYSNTNWTPSSSNSVGGQFFISKAAVTFNADLGKDPFGGVLKGTFTVDLANAQSFLSLETSLHPIQHAYVDYKVQNWDFLVFSLGLLKSCFNYSAFWDFPIPIPSFGETYAPVKAGSIADFGLMLSGKALPIEGLTKSLLSWQLQSINGEGFEKIYSPTSWRSDNFAFQAALQIMPMDGIMLGVSGRNQNVYTNNTTNENALSIFLSLLNPAGIPIDAAAEFAMKDLKYDVRQDHTNSGIYSYVLGASIGYGLLDGLLTPYLRYDYVNENNAMTNSVSNTYQYSILYFALKYQPISNTSLKLGGDINLTTRDWSSMAQLDVKLDFDIKQ